MPDTLLLGNQLVEEFLTGIQQEMIAYLDANNRNASGRSAASIQVQNVSNTGGQLIGADWIEYTFRGRGPGKMPPMNAIIDWLNSRGLPRGMAWSIAKKIAEQGTALYRELHALGKQSILDDIITQEKITKFIEDLTAIYTAQIQSEINSILQPA